jgi:hypothetical protein
MDYFGLNSPGELPSINEVLMDQPIEPYVMTGDNPVETDRPDPQGEIDWSGEATE